MYICGDAQRMARDVDAALRKWWPSMAVDADAYVEALGRDKRYRRDVY
jgi:sulfite reductase alpha subunit-like flavoprotein